MDAARYVVGVLALAVVVVSLARAGRTIRRRFMPELDGPIGVLAEIVVALSIAVVTSEVLGTFGLFGFAPVVAVTATIGALAYARGRAQAYDEQEPRQAQGVVVAEPENVPWAPYAAIFAVAVAVASWSSRTIDSLQHGITATVDTSWYHLPYAARFAHTGFTSHLYFPDGGSYTAFFPASSELLHGVGILLLGNDLLSPLMNLGWLALALFAAWCIGRPFGVASVALIGVAIVLTTPEIILDDAGSALNDVVGLALLLASVALLVNAIPVDAQAPWRVGCIVWAAMAAGLALGSKFTMIAPVGMLTVGVIVMAIRHRRAAVAVRWTIAIFVAGSYWYLRNTIRVGNPLPSLALGLGPVHLNHVKVPLTLTLANVGLDRHAWTAYLLPGLSAALGRAWWAILALAFIGCVLALIRGPGPMVRLVAVVAIVSFIAFVYSPQFLGTARAPSLFATNVRYCAATLVLGAVLLPIVAATLSARLVSAVLVVYVFTLVLTQISPTVWTHAVSRIAQPTQGLLPKVLGIVLGLVVLAAGLAWYASGWRNPHDRRLPVLAVVVATVMIGGFVLDRYYLDHRYENAGGMTNIYRWARHVSDARIALVGTFLQYPLYGKDSSNYVQYLAQRDSDGNSTPIKACPAWRRALNQGRYQFVVVTTPQFPFPTKAAAPQRAWTGEDPAATLVMHEQLPFPANVGTAQAWLYKISGRMSPDSCRRGGLGGAAQ